MPPSHGASACTYSLTLRNLLRFTLFRLFFEGHGMGFRKFRAESQLGEQYQGRHPRRDAVAGRRPAQEIPQRGGLRGNAVRCADELQLAVSLFFRWRISSSHEKICARVSAPQLARARGRSEERRVGKECRGRWSRET